MLNLIKELKSVMKEKRINTTTAAIFSHCDARQIDRWFKEQATPTLLYREAIKKGIRRLKKL